MTLPNQHEYMRRLLLALNLGLVDEGSAALATVGHDDKCGFLDGRTCDCDPDIRIDTMEGPCWILSDGTVTDQEPKK